MFEELKILRLFNDTDAGKALIKERNRALFDYVDGAIRNYTQGAFAGRQAWVIIAPNVRRRLVDLILQSAREMVQNKTSPDVLIAFISNQGVQPQSERRTKELWDQLERNRSSFLDCGTNATCKQNVLSKLNQANSAAVVNGKKKWKTCVSFLSFFLFFFVVVVGRSNFIATERSAEQSKRTFFELSDKLRVRSNVAPQIRDVRGFGGRSAFKSRNHRF